jgi:hypothetical protein
VLIVHGLIHLLGVPLLWRLGQPGQLRYADAHPAPGSAGGLAVGSLWLVAGALFIAAAVLLVASRPAWRPVCVIAVLVSAPVLAMSASVAAAGLVIDAAVVVAVITSLRGKAR